MSQSLKILALISSLATAAILFSCGRPPPEVNNFAGNERPGIASGVLPESARQQQLQTVQKQMNDLSTQLSAQEEQTNDLVFKINDVNRQIQAAQAQQAQLQTSTQNEIAQKSQQYATQDIQSQNQQLQLDIARAQVENQINAQKNLVAGLSGIVNQQEAWGFPSTSLEQDLPRLSEEQQKLSQLENQYWGIQQQSAQLAATHSQNKQWYEARDRQQTDESYQKQQDALNKQIQQLQTQYEQLNDQQQKLEASNTELAQQYRIARDNYQSLQAQTPT